MGLLRTVFKQRVAYSLFLHVYLLQESMKMMGMKGWLHWASWYFKFSVIVVIFVAIMTFFLHIKIGSNRGITCTDPFVTFVFLLLYGLSVMTLCFAISTFFSKGTITCNLFSIRCRPEE